MPTNNPTDAIARWAHACLPTLEATWSAAKDAMHASNTPATRIAYLKAAGNYNNALDAAEQDSTRNWAR